LNENLSISKNVINKLKYNRQKRLNGDLVAIPWSLPRLADTLPGIQQAHYVIITANAKVGKTQVGDYLYLYQPIEWWLENRSNTNIKIKIFYFSLEMSAESKMLAAISHKLFISYDIIIAPQKLQSLFKGYILDEKILNIIESIEFQQWLKDFESVVSIVDNARNPYGIFNTVRSYMEDRGHWTYKTMNWQNEDGSYEERKVKDQFMPDDPDEYVIVITDHVSLLQPQKGQNLHDAMGQFSADFCLQLRDKYKCCVVNIQQQSAASEAQQFTNKGTTIVDKLKPSADGLADNKLCGRDCNLMLGLFHPARYDIQEYKGWDLSRVGRNHRELLILLNRDGEGSASLPLYFNGSSNYFRELPKEPSREVYARIENWNKQII
jgi:hypothetical protein